MGDNVEVKTTYTFNEPASCLSDLLPMYVGKDVRLGVSGISPGKADLHNFGPCTIVEVQDDVVVVKFRDEKSNLCLAPIVAMRRDEEDKHIYLTLRRRSIDSMRYQNLTVGR